MAKLMFAYKISIGYPLIMLALFALIVILQNHLAYGRPYSPPWTSEPMPFRNDTACEIPGEIQTLCQKCAKQTKSMKVYPLCCEDKDAVREWCKEYMSFGLQ